MQFRNALALCAVLALPASPVLATTTNLYVADYGTGNLLQYTATLQTVGGHPQEVLTQVLPTQTINPPAGGSITEGINGTANTVLTIVKTSSGSYEIARYNNAGTFLNYVGGGATTFSGVGSFIVSNDASTMYVADQSGNKLYEVNLATGLVVHSVGLNQVHDVAILPNGNVIAEDLNSGSGFSGIVEYNADLTGGHTFIPQGTSSSTDTVGSAGNLQGHNQYGFAVDNIVGSPYYGDFFTTSDDRSGGPGNSTGESGTLYAFTQSGNFVASWTPTQGSNLNVGTFGISFGPDGNIYFANLGGVVLSDNAGNQVGEFNVATGTFSTYINGRQSGLINAVTGLSAPKYLNWQTDFSPANDPGAPEPSGAVTSAFGVGMLGLMLLGSIRRSRRTVRAG